MLSFFRRQRPSDTGKSDKDKKEGKRKEKQGVVPTSVRDEEETGRAGGQPPPTEVPAGGKESEAAVVASQSLKTGGLLTPPTEAPVRAKESEVGVAAQNAKTGGAGARANEQKASVVALQSLRTAGLSTQPTEAPAKENSQSLRTAGLSTQPTETPAKENSQSLRTAGLSTQPTETPATRVALPSHRTQPTEAPATQSLAETTATTERTLFASLITPALRPKPEPTRSGHTEEEEPGQLDQYRRNLVNQEAKFQAQLAALTSQLAERDSETNKLTHRMEELKRDVEVKSGGIDRLQAELSAAHKESDCVRQKLRKMEDDVTVYRQKNHELSEELLKKDDEMAAAETRHKERVEQLESSIKDLEASVKQLEKDMEKIRLERDRFEEEKTLMEAEREEEMKIVQEALEESQEEKELIQARFEKDFERLRTVNTDREQQLLNDFEWKLREVEQACKRRLEDKDKKANEKIINFQKEMADKIKEADEKLQEVERIKKVEAEAAQLRGVVHEQQRSIRTAQRQTEQLQVNEKMLKEEVNRLRTVIDTEKNMSHNLQSINEKKISDMEKKLQTRLEEQKGEIDQRWEERLRRECYRLRTELEQLHLEEKQTALNKLKVEKEREISEATRNLEHRLNDNIKKVSELTETLNDKEVNYKKELDRVLTNSDRDVLDLRRKLDKMDMSYQDQIEKLKERHEQEIEQLNWESSRKIQQLEQNWQIQNSSTRATLELVKEQMERDAQDKLEALEAKYQEKIEHQWERLTQDKEKEIALLQTNHQKELESIVEEFQHKLKHSSSREEELLKKILKLEGQCSIIGDLQGNTDLLQGTVQVLSDQILNQNKEIQRTQTQMDQKIREREEAINAEWEAKLRSITEEHQQSQEQLRHKITLLEEVCSKQKNQQSLPEDLQEINALRSTLAERDQQLESLSEEKQFYQMELVNRETTYNQTFGSQPTVGVLDPLQHANGPKKKGGGPQPPRVGPKPSRKHRKGGGQVARSKSLDLKLPPKPPNKQKNTSSPAVPESPDETFTISTL